MENAAIEANRLNKENADLRDEIDKVLRERDEARAAEEHLRGQHQYSVGLSMALEERDQARRERDQEREACAMYAERSGRFAEQADKLQADLDDCRARIADIRTMLERVTRERDLALGRLENEIKAANQARMAEERARESLDELDAAIYECLPSDYDDDSPLDCVERAGDKLRELARERDEWRDKFHALNQTAGELCNACGWAFKIPGESCRCEVVKERDEARAEVERLRAEAERWKRSCNVFRERDWPKAFQATVTSLEQEVSDAHEQLAKLRKLSKPWEGDAYRRGAEAMREACACVVEDADDGVPLQCLADDLRERPIPEET